MRFFRKNKIRTSLSHKQKEYLAQRLNASESRWENTLALANKHLSHEEFFAEIKAHPNLYCIRIVEK